MKKTKNKNDLRNEIIKIAGEVNKPKKQNKGKNIIAYARISDYKQLENDSTDTQLHGINEFVQWKNLITVKEFEILPESSKRGSLRPSVKELLKFIDETEHVIHAVVVYHSNRFTRDTIFGGQFLDKLIERGIGFIDINDPSDIFTETGRIRQIDAFKDAEKDNITRKKFINGAILKKLKEGYTMRKPPLGYDIVRIGKGKNKTQKATINQDGKLLKEAFKLKLEYNYSNVLLAEMLTARGLKISDKRLGELFKNPYYCGLIKDKRLIETNGLADGLHPKLITETEFVLINSNKKRKIKKNEIPQLPLRKHLTCSSCNTNMTGYKASKGTTFFYYKCGTKGCNTNVKNEIIHDLYYDLLKSISFNIDYLPQLEKALNQVFKTVNKSNIQLRKKLKSKIKEVDDERLKAIKGMVQYPKEKDDYKEYKEICENDLNNLNQQLSNVKVGFDEINKNINDSLRVIHDLPSIWLEADFRHKVRLQELVFPDGVSYKKKSNQLIPNKINPIFLLVNDLNEYFRKNNQNNDSEYTHTNSQEFDEGAVKNRTSNYIENITVNPRRYWSCSNDDEFVGEEETRLVVLLSRTSNFFSNDLCDSMDELKGFVELYELLNK